MTLYKLSFVKKSQKEWDKLSIPIKQQFYKKLNERLENPHVPKDKLRRLQNCYKIKLRDAGYRLVYQVIDNELVIFVISAGKRNKDEAYENAHDRLH